MAISSFENVVTEMIINNIDKWYTGYKDVCIEYAQQVGTRYKNGGHGIVDLVVHIFRPYKQANGNRYFFEVKSSIGDLNTGKGLNLYGMYNYVVYPKSLITSLPGVLTYDIIDKKLKSIGCEHAGIIGVISDNDFIVEKKARRYNGDGMPNGIKAHKYKNGRD